MTRERQATNDQQTSLNVLALWPEPVSVSYQNSP